MISFHQSPSPGAGSYGARRAMWSGLPEWIVSWRKSVGAGFTWRKIPGNSSYFAIARPFDGSPRRRRILQKNATRNLFKISEPVKPTVDILRHAGAAWRGHPVSPCHVERPRPPGMQAAAGKGSQPHPPRSMLVPDHSCPCGKADLTPGNGAGIVPEDQRRSLRAATAAENTVTQPTVMAERVRPRLSDLGFCTSLRRIPRKGMLKCRWLPSITSMSGPHS